MIKPPMMKCRFGILFFIVSAYCSPPSILINPIGGIYSPQSSAILDCVVSGEPVPEITWFKDDQTLLTLNKHDNGSLEITQFSSSDNGYYYCIARNEFGSVQSLKALLRVAFIDTFSSTSKTLMYQENAPFNLSCDTPQSLPPVQVTWYHGNSLVMYNNRIGMTLDHILVFSYTEDSDSGPWTCKVKNTVIGGAEETVNSYLLSLENSSPVAHPTIQFVYTPLSQSVITGIAVQLQCFAIGRPVPTYTWKKDGFTISSSDKIVFEQHSRVIVINNITSADSGVYTCQAKQNNVILYHNASIVVKDPPLITHSFNATTQYASLSISLVCTAKGTLPISWIWRNNTNQIIRSDDIDIIDNGSESTLIINNLGPYDSGVIQCVAHNSDTGDDQASQLLEVITKEPVVKENPDDIFVIVGENITLKCICEAFPYPSFSWLEDNNKLTLSENHYLSANDPFSGNLIITSVQTSDSGVYQCVCDNIEGVRLSSAGILTVIDEPIISAYPNGSLVREGDNVILHCMIEDIFETTISYSWTRDFKPIPYSLDIALYGNGSLNILDFNHSSHSGKYECNVQLKVSSSTAQPIIFNVGAAYITTVPPAAPSPPLYVSVTSVTSTTVLLSWTESIDNGGLQILEYIVQIINHKRDDCETSADVNLTVSSTEMKIDTLLPYNKYSVLVYAQNSLGVSLPSEMSEIIVTAEEAPSSPPVNVNATENGRVGELSVNWELPPCTQRNGIIVNYTLIYVVLTTDSSTAITTTTNDTFFTLTDLPVLQDYKVQVAASTSIGIGPFSDFIIARTSIASVPNEPRNVTVVIIDYDLYISWEPPHPRRNEPVNELTTTSMYLIIHQSETFYVSVTNYTYMDLEEGSNISFTIAALNSFGVGKTVTINIVIPETTESTVQTMSTNESTTMNEEQVLYEQVWFIAVAGGVGGVVILFLLSVCVLVCVVSYKRKQKHMPNNDNRVIPVQISGSASSFAYPNRKFTVLDKMMQVESMSSQECIGTVNTVQNDTESIQSVGTVHSQTSSLRSKYQYRSPIEQEEYQKLGQLNNKDRRSSNGSQKHFFSSTLVSSKKNNNTYHRKRARGNTTREVPASPTDTVSSFEYESQPHILHRINNVSHFIQHRDNSPGSESQTTTDVEHDSLLDVEQVQQHSIYQRNRLNKKSSKQVPLDLARMTALPHNPKGSLSNIPHHMPSALEQDDLSLQSNIDKVHPLHHFPNSQSRSYDNHNHLTSSTLTSLV